ncbi:hypothetical protein GW17_00041778 [Ensete ventricosum]|nr:hypothetical protein GW17_00041778 [Ensete ventricosum]
MQLAFLFLACPFTGLDELYRLSQDADIVGLYPAVGSDSKTSPSFRQASVAAHFTLPPSTRRREREREREGGGGGGGNPLAVLVGHVDADANLLPRTTRRLPSPSHPLDAAHGFPSVARQPVRAAALPRQLVAPAVGLTASLQPFRLFSYSSGDTFPAVPAVGLRWISSLPAFSSATRDSVYHVPALFPIAVVELRLDLGRGRSRGGRGGHPLAAELRLHLLLEKEAQTAATAAPLLRSSPAASTRKERLDLLFLWNRSTEENLYLILLHDP